MSSLNWLTSCSHPFFTILAAFCLITALSSTPKLQAANNLASQPPAFPAPPQSTSHQFNAQQALQAFYGWLLVYVEPRVILSRRRLWPGGWSFRGRDREGEDGATYFKEKVAETTAVIVFSIEVMSFIPPQLVSVS